MCNKRREGKRERVIREARGGEERRGESNQRREANEELLNLDRFTCSRV